MGADVELYIECRRSNESEWKLDPRHYIVPLDRKEFKESYPDDGVWHMFIHRNYELFGVMAGVRGGNNIISPRGIPEDSSLIAKVDPEEDYSSFARTWFSVRNVRDIYFTYARISTYESLPSRLPQKLLKFAYFSERSFEDLEMNDISSLMSYLLTLRQYGPINPWDDGQKEIAKHLPHYFLKPLVDIVQGYFGSPRRNWKVRCVLWFNT